MSVTLRNLQHQSESHDVEPCDVGFLIVRKPGAAVAFAELARQVLDKAGETYAAFPRVDGHGGYESVLVVPIEE